MLQHLGIQNVLRMQKVYHIPGGLWAESERVGVGGWLMRDGSVVAGRTGGSAGRLALPADVDAGVGVALDAARVAYGGAAEEHRVERGRAAKANRLLQ